MENERDRYILRCFDFWDAAEYAAEQDWWLHSWKWEYADSDEIEVVDKLGELPER